MSAWTRLLPASATTLAITGLIAIGQFGRPGLEAQSPAFEVASVKANRSGQGLPFVGFWPGGRFAAPNATVRDLVRVAYGFEDYQVLGGPSWMGSERFEVLATTDSGASVEQLRAMLRTLLADRFKLTAHIETRDLPIYALVMSTSAGRLGERLRRSGPECSPIAPPAGVPTPPPPPPPPAGAAGPIFRLLTAVGTNVDPLRCASMFFPGQISAREITMAHLAIRLLPLVSRPVFDRTGLSGAFDVDLVYTPENQTPGIAPPNATSGGPSIFTAVQEQLGLKLDPQRSPLEVVVIDRVEQPTEN